MLAVVEFLQKQIRKHIRHHAPVLYPRRNVVDGTGVKYWWDNGNNQIAWARGNKGFIAINNDNYDMSLNNYYVSTPGRLGYPRRC